MTFYNVQVGDKLHVKVALTIYNIISITMHTTEVTDTEIVATWDDIEDMKEQYFRFDRGTGIVIAKPKRYTRATTAWVQRISGERPSEFR